MRYISSCSFGKDSLAQIIVAREMGEPLDENLYCEVMFTPEISAEVPDHRDFIYEVAIPKLERDYGLKTTIIRSDRTMQDTFYHVREKGNNIGKIAGFPIPGACMVNRDCKMRALKQWRAQQTEPITEYVGIAIDEKVRLARLKPGKVSILAKYGITESMATEICKFRGLYSPGYQYSKRNGCFFCPNAAKTELFHIFRNHPDLWQMLLEMQAAPNLIYPKWARGVSLFDLDEEFRRIA